MNFLHHCVLPKSVLAVSALLLSSTAFAWQAPEFDRTYGWFNPPEFVPVDVTTDLDGNIYALDLYHLNIHKFDADGNRLAVIQPEVQLNWPRGIAVDTQGFIYIGDSGASQIGTFWGSGIFKMDQQGHHLAAWASRPSGISIGPADEIAVAELGGTAKILDTDGNTLLSIPAGILVHSQDVDADIAPDGSFYVTDQTQQKVFRFDRSGAVIQSWGVGGTGDGQFKGPVAISIDNDGNVFVTDRRNNRVQKFTADGVFLAEGGVLGNGPGMLLEPHGLTVDQKTGDVLVANYHGHNFPDGHNVLRFSNDLVYKSSIQGRNSKLWEWSEIRGVAVDSRDDVYIVDNWNQRVSKFDNDGNFILSWGYRGQYDGPVFNMPKNVYVDANDFVYVSDDGHVRKFNPDGSYIKRWGKYLSVRGIAVDAAGYLYITQQWNNRVVKINQDTDQAVTFGSFGAGPGQLDNPFGIAIGPNNKLYVVDNKNFRIQRWDLDGNYELEWGGFGDGPTQFKNPRRIAIDELNQVYVIDAGVDKVKVYDPDGNYIGEWGIKGSGHGEFAQGHSIALDHRGGAIISDEANDEVSRFQFGGVQPPVMPPVAGQPAYAVGSDHGVFVYRSAFDGPYHLRVLGIGGQDLISVKVLSDRPLGAATPVGLEAGDVFSAGGSALSLDTNAVGEEDGVDFALPLGARAMVSVAVNGVPMPQLLRFGAGMQAGVVSGWVRDSGDLPALPAFAGGFDRGLFVGTNAGSGIAAYSNGDTRANPGTAYFDDLWLMFGGAPSAVTGLSIEANDLFEVTDSSVHLQGGVSSWWDGVDVALPGSLPVGLAFTENGLFRSYKVNYGDGSLGLPSASWIPPVTASGPPAYDPAAEAGLFVWRDAATGAWRVRATAGGGAQTRYKGILYSTNPAQSVTGVGLENSDVLDGTIPFQVRFDLRVSNIWQDGFDLSYPPGTSLLLNMDAGVNSPAQVRIGPEKLPPLTGFTVLDLGT